MITFVKLFLYFCGVFVISASRPSLQSDSHIIFEKFEVIEENPDFITMRSLKITKFNRTTAVLNGTFEFRKTVTNTVKLDLLGYEKYGMEYKRSIIDLRSMVYCQYLKFDKIGAVNFRAATNLTDECPIPSGTYFINNYIIDQIFHPPVVIGTQWRADLILFDEDSIWAHFRIYYKFQTKSL